MKLLGERILVKKIDDGSKIIRLDTEEELKKVLEGEIVALGNRITPESGCDELQMGDVIQWSTYAGEWIKIGDDVTCVLRPNDVICVLDQVAN